MRVVAIIPARLSSTRLKEKLLIEVNQKSILQHVYENVRNSKLFDEVIIATDSDRIINLSLDFGAKTMMTSKTHLSGTDRIAEVASKIECDIVINVQGDEPLVSHSHLSHLIDLIKMPHVTIATLCSAFKEVDIMNDPSNVKVVFDKQGKALYFSRHPIPFQRDMDEVASNGFHHIGLYAFKRDTLIAVSKMEQTSLERLEKLEQLRWLENDIPIYVEKVEGRTVSIDTKEDLDRFREMLQE